MNIALEQTEEHVNGIVTNRYGDAFIRGNNGQMVPRGFTLRSDV
jgi:U6 snRNA-associated Sm-like protein LSm6